jgi:hypothetical protein
VSTDHNEFVKAAILHLGPRIIAQGSLAQQLVAAESLLAGMIGIIAKMEGVSLLRAETYLRAVANGAVKRLPSIIEK